MANASDGKQTRPATKIRRRADRAIANTEDKFSFLDQSLIGFLGAIQDGFPIVLPMAFVRFENEIHLHGSVSNNNLNIGLGGPVCFSTTIVDGLVLAKAAANHSLNYRSTVVFGQLEEIADEDQKARSMEGLIERYYPGRMQTLRNLTPNELRKIRVAKLRLNHMSAKQRSGPPASDKNETHPDAWVGTIDVNHLLGKGVPDDQTHSPFPAISHLLFPMQWRCYH